jgi:hypothetical protein
MRDTPHITQNFARPSYRPDVRTGMDPEIRRMALAAAGLGGIIALAVGAVSLSHHVHHGIPVIAPPPGPVRIKPTDPGGMKVAGLEDLAANAGPERLAPAAEQPELRALHAKTHPAAPAPIAPPAPVRQAAATAPEPQAAPTGTVVQLAAFESREAAEEDWGRMAEKMPGLFNGHRPDVTSATLAGRTIWRLRTGGFADIATATEFCGQVRAQGGDCSIAAF